MKTAKRIYLDALLQRSSTWIRASYEHPSPYMTAMDLKLHLVALRIKGC